MNRAMTMPEVLLPLLMRVEAREKREQGAARRTPRVSSGLPSLDKAIGTWGGLSLLVGDDQAGLYALADCIAFGAAQVGRVILVCRDEAPARTALRLLTRGLGTSTRAFLEGSPEAKDWDLLAAEADRLALERITLLDASRASPQEVLATCTHLNDHEQVALIALDGIHDLEAGLLGELELLSMDAPVLAVVKLKRSLSNDRGN